MPDRRGDRGRHQPDSVAMLEARRITFAASRVADHAARELSLLERATQVRDDDRARELEWEADTARRYCVAISEEHGLRQ